MSDVFRPMTLGEILDRTYRLMLVYWRVFVGLGAVPAVAVGAMMIAAIAWWIISFWPQIFAQPGELPHMPIFPIVLFFASSLIAIPVYALYLPAAMHAATQANLGVKVGFGEAYAVAWQQYGRYLWLMVLLIVYIAGPFYVAGSLIGGGAWLMVRGAEPGSIPTGIFMLIPVAMLSYFGFLVYAVLMMLRFAVAFPASVVENLPARAALRRSTTLTCGGRGRIFLVMLVVYLVTYAASMVIMSVLGGIVSLGALAAMNAHITAGSMEFYVLIGLGAIAYLLSMAIYAGFTYAAMNTAIAVIYHDQRWRKDGVTPAALPA